MIFNQTLPNTESLIAVTIDSFIDKEVLDNYHALNTSVDAMDRKVEIAMKKHESEFLYAYRTHIKKIKKELEEIKRKSEQQEKMFSANDRIRYLEKEVIVFREEALKLYDKLEQKDIQLTILKAKISEMEGTWAKNEADNRDLIIKMKKMESARIDNERTIFTLQQKLREQSEKIAAYENKLQKRQAHRQYMQSATRSYINPEKLDKPPPLFFKTSKNQLQSWFLQCVKSVKKEISQRKNNLDSLDLSKINNIDDFKLVDKLRLFELLLENQRLLNWLYHKLFPDRMDGIGEYLTRDSGVNSSRSNRYAADTLSLPKVSEGRKSGLSKISIKNGKMNISLV